MQSSNTSGVCGTFVRHTNALFKKNLINWKRTPIGSGMEIVIPILITLMTVRQVLLSDKDPYGHWVDLTRYAHPLYPTAKFDDDTGKWSSNFQYMLEQQEDMQNFMTYANLNNSVNSRNESTYFPGTDAAGPYFFFPEHCSMSLYWKGEEKWGQPIIGYIERNNSI